MAYMIPGAALSAPAAYRDVVTRWLSTIPDIGYQFAQMDVNGDGVLTLQELQMVIAPYGAQWAALPAALMAMGDRDGNGIISLAEFLQLGQLLQWNAEMRGSLAMPLAGPPAPFAGNARYNRAQQGQQLRQAQRDLVIRWLSTFPDPDREFFVLDANHDGYVTPNEIAMACATAGPEVQPPALPAYAPTDYLLRAARRLKARACPAAGKLADLSLSTVCMCVCVHAAAARSGLGCRRH
jgi:hypothetical protein